LIYQKQLFHVGNFDFKLHHVIVIGVLVLAFSTSFLIRSQNAEYGFELNEFDPFFNFRATEYIIENGLSEYFQWHDTKSWYLPEDSNLSGDGNQIEPSISGRNVSATSQSMLHITAAITYQIFGANSSLYDFTVLFPAVIGSLTVVIIFALVRLFAGTAAGLFASLFFAISLPILIRGSLGWFKSEPLGLFYALLGLYLFLSALNSTNKKIIFSKIILGGIIMTFAMASWGGTQFFIIPIGLFIFTLPFVRKDHKLLLTSIPLFVGVFLLTAIMFERPGPSFVFGIGGILLVIPTIFLIFCTFVQKISNDKNKIRNSLIFLITIIIIGSFLVIISEELDLLSIPSFRYLNAINPFFTTSIALVDSVAEHATTSIRESFFFHSILMIFASLGIWFILSKKELENKLFLHNDMKIFVLIFGIIGVYVSSAFVRLEVFASLSLIILGAIGLSVLTKEFFKIQSIGKKKYLFKILYVVIILFIFVLPLTYPSHGNWINVIDTPQTILNGGTNHPASNDWLETLEWIKMNTSEDAIIASWWDYGYWISTMSERTTLIDNATISTWQIELMAQILLSNPDEGWKLLKDWNVDYVVVFVSAEKYPTVEENEFLYVLGGGGDESKLPWFMKIADVSLQNYMNPDGRSANYNFYNETLLGKMIPFTPLGYANIQTQEQFDNWTAGTVQVSAKNIEYYSENDPFQLVFSSSSFTDNKSGPMNSIFVYKINKNYSSPSYAIQE
jgi:dolichyl-diphosphooligosaccharide---protein glycosyltransferase